jgi:hypothetical protein
LGRVTDGDDADDIPTDEEKNAELRIPLAMEQDTNFFAIQQYSSAWRTA